jgi:Rnl2 family RNA ligase
MPESPQAWNLDAAQYRALEREKWVVTEKIHGANLCFVVAQGQIQTASRRRLLEPAEDFFGHAALQKRLEPALLALERSLGQPFHLFGEVFGGSYPHPQVKNNPDICEVQTGIHYSPNLEFCAFDLRMGDLFLPFPTLQVQCQNAGIMVSQPLLIGKMRDALEFCERFPSTLPALLGLPPLERTPAGNLAEGIVIKTLNNAWLETATGWVRPIFKKKILEFAEDLRFHQAEKPQSVPQKTDTLELLKWQAYGLINANRFAASVSKIGRDPQHSRAVFQLLCREVWEEILPLEGAILHQAELKIWLEGEWRKWMGKR